MPLPVLQKVLGHSSIRTTALYRKNSEEPKEKVKQLEQAKREQEKIIINLKSDKKRLKKQLIQVQSEKDTLLKMLAGDLKKQQQTLSQLDNKQNNHELHQQLIAQIQVLTKN